MEGPGYLGLLATGELADRAKAARELLSPCRLCPRRRRCFRAGRPDTSLMVESMMCLIA
jgi:hypothetical protein